MKLKFISLLGFSFFASYMPIASSSTLNCSAPAFAPVSEEGRIYSFTAAITCRLDGADRKIEVLKVSYLESLSSDSSYKIGTVDRNAAANGLHGFKFNALEERKTEHGVMKIKSYIYLLDNKADKFEFTSQSYQIAADGNAKYTQEERQQVQVRKTGTTSYEVKLSIFAKVRRPSLAPKGMFEKKVKEGIAKDLNRMATLHANKIKTGLRG